MKIGKKQMEQLSGFGSSAVNFGISAALALVYFTNWRVIANLIPYYNGQFVKDPGGPPVVEEECDAPGCKPPPDPPEDPCLEWDRREAAAEEAKAALAAAKAEAAEAAQKAR